jgi:putative PIG3 family NAD(P)H quinone oxidoreductase
MQRLGHYPPPPGISDVIGLECSGTIVEVGEGVTERAVGDEVCALLAGGAYAEQVVVPAGQTMPVPAGVDLVTAAGIAEVAATVWSNVTDLSDLQPEEWFLVHGGASGIGTWSIQYAHALGAKVATTAGSEDKLAKCRELGAQLAINYKTAEFQNEILGATHGRGVDVILDTIGAKYLEANLMCLAPFGRVTTIGLMGGREGTLNLGLLLAKQGTWRATSLRFRTVEDKSRICAAVVEQMWQMVSVGSITPIIDRVLPMSSAAEAHQVLADSTHVGKVLLTVG